MGSNNPLLSELINGSFTWPNAAINEMGPLPSAPRGNLGTPDNNINPPDQTKLLQGGLQDFIYSYGPNPARITTQTQNAIPNKVQRIIPQMFIPAAQAESTTQHDPKLEHHTTDGDIVFSIKMNPRMVNDSQRYVIHPAGYSHKSVKLLNLATVNYILWGLQVGALMPAGSMWVRYFSELCKADYDLLHQRLQQQQQQQEPEEEELSVQELIWNFIQTVLAPYGVQHGFDTQGGQHEGSRTKVVTNAVDYVSSFAIEGKLLKVNNLWKACDVYEDDDLVLALRFMTRQNNPLTFNLCSSNRSSRIERCPMLAAGFWYLRPEVLAFKTIIETPHIHIGRSQKMVTSYSRATDLAGIDARASLGGTPLQMTFEPCFMDSDAMCFKKMMVSTQQLSIRQQQTELLLMRRMGKPSAVANAAMASTDSRVRVTGMNLAMAMLAQNRDGEEAQLQAEEPTTNVGEKRAPEAPNTSTSSTSATQKFTAMLGGAAKKKRQQQTPPSP